jgi:hypothetical protein
MRFLSFAPDELQLARMNLAVYGLEGDIQEANTYYEDAHTLAGKCDFVMANPPFNVDEVDAERVKDDKRLPFGLPGANKSKKVLDLNDRIAGAVKRADLDEDQLALFWPDAQRRHTRLCPRGRGSLRKYRRGRFAKEIDAQSDCRAPFMC